MTDHPSTYRADDTHHEGIQWDDRASIHEANDGGGVFDGAKRLQSGTFAEMIRQVMAYPEEERSRFAIEKAGDRKYTAAEAEALAAREDFPSA